MAGPTAEILLPQISKTALKSWCDIVAAFSCRENDHDFWVASSEISLRADPLPFYWHLIQRNDELWILHGQDEAVQAVRETFGFTPVGSIGFGAMRRGRPSDQILAAIASAYLDDHEGALLFHGLLAPVLQPQAWRHWSARSAQERAAAFQTRVGQHSGRIIAVTIDGEPAYHAVDLAFLRYWIAHRAFHFVN